MACAIICLTTKGRFRWVACQLDELKKCTKRKKTLQYTLDHLPDTLEETYDQVLSGISHPTDASDAAKLLLWLAYSEHPLHIDDISSILEFDVDLEESSLNSDGKLSSSEDVLWICSSLVTRMDNNTVQLAHASVKQYVLDKPRIIKSGITIDPSHGHAYVGQCCLAYLLRTKESCPAPHKYKLSHQNKERYMHSLIRYSAKYWPKHILATGQDETHIQLTKQLFVQSSFPFQNWVKVYNYDVNYFGDGTTRMNESSLLQCAAFHGLQTVVEWILPTVNRDREIMEALCVASKYGHRSVVTTLLQTSVDLNAHHQQAAMALKGASIEGHKEIIGLLLGRGADVNAQGGEHGNALQAASHGGHIEIIEFLLERGADVNAQGGKYGNALQTASWKGNMEIVELLLKMGADVNAQGGAYGRALQAASCWGHKEIIELLLEKGADINAEGVEGGYALQVASAMGHREVVELLLERGADVNAQQGFHGNSLHAASCGGYKEIVELLLAKEADVNAQGGFYGNALQAASMKGHVEIAGLLLESGADVNAHGGRFGSALQAALQVGHMELATLLLENGADHVNAQEEKYGNTPQAASRDVDALRDESIKGCTELSDMLLECASAIQAIQGEYGNATQVAPLMEGLTEILELLRENGAADVNAQRNFDVNALLAMIEKCNKGVIELLLETGSNINDAWQGRFQENALQAASCRASRADFIQFLCDRGGNVNALEGGQLEFESALAQHGAQLDSNEVVLLVLLSGAAYTNINHTQPHSAELDELENYLNKMEFELHNVLANGGSYISAMKLLLDQGVEQVHLNIALQIALENNGDQHMVDLLLKHGAKQIE